MTIQHNTQRLIEASKTGDAVKVQRLNGKIQ